MNEFDDIRPYEPAEMKQAFNDLLADRQFNVLMKGLLPWLPKVVRNGLLRLSFRSVKTPLQFQKRYMKPIVEYIMRKCTDGCSFDHAALQGQSDARFTFVSNHRDIVLDAAFLDVLLINADYPTTVEIGIGDNLLIYPWIKRLVRMNKAFTVRRGLSPKEMMASSQLMSRYIHYAVLTKRENIWIAQREGRAKDSDDRTQEAVLKMLAMGGALDELNIVATHNIITNVVDLVDIGAACALTMEGAVNLFEGGRLTFRPVSPALEMNTVLVWKKFNPFFNAAGKFLDYFKTMYAGHT